MSSPYDGEAIIHFFHIGKIVQQPNLRAALFAADGGFCLGTGVNFGVCHAVSEMRRTQGSVRPDHLLHWLLKTALQSPAHRLLKAAP